MKACEFMTWLRDAVGVIRHSTEGDKLAKPSNKELRRWLQKGSVLVNGKILAVEDDVHWPITQLVFFPKNDKARTTIV